jgi:hypothetical protein
LFSINLLIEAVKIFNFFEKQSCNLINEGWKGKKKEIIHFCNDSAFKICCIKSSFGIKMIFPGHFTDTKTSSGSDELKYSIYLSTISLIQANKGFANHDNRID